MKQQIIQRQLPDLTGMFPHQVEVLRDPHRFKTICWHRRARKTSTAIEKIFCEAMINPGKVYWHIFPSYREAKEAIWKDPQMLFRIVPKESIAKINEQELTVVFKNKSVFTLKGADKPESLLGAGPTGVILDEFAMMKYETWERVIYPILRANPKSWAWMTSTPKGKNHFYKHFQIGEQPHPEWKSWLLPASKSGVLSPEDLEAAKNDLTESLFQQEFEVNFLENSATVFRQVKENASLQPQNPKENHQYVMGVDLARLVDWTVCSVFDRSTNEMVYMDRFNNLDWDFQKQKIMTIARRYNSALTVIDSTGVGDAIANQMMTAVDDERIADLNRAGVIIQPFKFTTPSKKNLVEKTAIMLEKGEIKLLNIPEIIDEFESFSYVMGSTGKVKFGAPLGKHDDICMSVCLAVAELSHYMYEVQNPKPEKSWLAQYKNRVIERLNDPDIEYYEHVQEWESLPDY